jgi:putative Ca2+/H+ antiporter (TMEM165/GDT1 family)
MEAFLTAAGLVAISEIGDRTQLLAFVLASRFRRPGVILLGILVATIANHTLAAGAGHLVRGLLAPGYLRPILGASFVAMAIWTLVPDTLDDDTSQRAGGAHGAFIATVIAFFLAEMGDKTQIATIALAARYASVATVVAGTTAGMMLANLPAVYGGHLAGHRVDLRLVRYLAGAIFLVQGVVVFAGYGMP